MAELALRIGRDADAREHFAAAIRVARNPMERRFLERRLLLTAPVGPT
jgi:predicted RNA polymerase sigma factor